MAAKHPSFIQRLISKKRVVFFGFIIIVVVLWLFCVWYIFAVDIKKTKWQDPLFVSAFITIFAVMFIYGGFKKFIDKMLGIYDKNEQSLKAAEAGLEGEDIVEAELKRIFKGRIYRDLKLNPNDNYDFDFIIVSPRKGVIVLEVKDWLGKTIFYGDCIERVDLNDKKSKKWGWGDPRKRIKHNVENLRKYFYSQSLTNLPIVKAMVVVGDEIMVRGAGGVFIVKKIGELKGYIDTIHNKGLTKDSYQRLIKTLDRLQENM
jgi:hypothetical protein